jgi:hypothetical protein
MSDTKFTKGEWAIEDDEERVFRAGAFIGIYIAKKDSGRIAKVFGNCLVTTRANAALIAAAPQMYEALENARAILTTLYPGGIDGGDYVCVSVENALKAARGEQ